MLQEANISSQRYTVNLNIVKVNYGWTTVLCGTVWFARLLSNTVKKRIYQSFLEKKADKEVNRPQQQCNINNSIRNKQVSRQQQLCKEKREQNTQITIHNFFTFIENSRRQSHSPPSAFIRLLSIRYKIKDRASNGNSERIQSVLCEDTLRVKWIIVVWKSPY